MGAYHGSSYEIQSEWDPVPTYVVQRLWDPGGLKSMSIKDSTMARLNLGHPKQYLDYFLWLALLSHPFLVVLVLHLVSKLQLEQLDQMGRL